MTKLAHDFLQGRIYQMGNKKDRRSIFYRIEEFVGDGMASITSFNPDNPVKKFNRRVCRISSLQSYRLVLIPYDQEHHDFQSGEGKRLRLERQRAAKAAKTDKTDKTDKPGSQRANDVKATRAPRPVGVFLDVETFARVDVFRASQQEEADARGNGESVNSSESIRRLVRMGLAVWESKQRAAKAAE